MLRASLIALAVLPACAFRCGDNTFPSGADASTDAATIVDGGGTADSALPLTSVDFAIGGCAELTDDGCTGDGPLTLSFAAISSAPVQVYLWQFGDGDSSTAATPVHTYASPGQYTVSLNVEGPGGGLGEVKPDWVTVNPGGLGRACGSDSDCATGRCLCDPADGPCASPLGGRGICAAACVAEPCDDGVCADLRPSGSPPTEDWQARVCLAACEGGCPDGLVCRDVLDPVGAWTRGCFVEGLLADLGQSCVDASGTPSDEGCSSGQCAPTGARAMCGFDCSTLPCPAGSTCADFAGPLGSQCLRDCEGFACNGDPWLACEPPGNPGDGGFTIDGPPASDGYCAPRFCGDDPAICQPDGACVAGICEAL